MRTVLACVDLSASGELSATSQAVLACAHSLADPAGHLVLLHVAAPDPDFVGYDIGPQSVRDEVAFELRVEHRRVQALAATLAGSGLTVTPLTVQGAVSPRILEHAGRLHADLIVLGSTHRSAFAERFAGSTVQAVLRAATVPVVVVPPSVAGQEGSG